MDQNSMAKFSMIQNLYRHQSPQTLGGPE